MAYQYSGTGDRRSTRLSTRAEARTRPEVRTRAEVRSSRPDPRSDPLTALGEPTRRQIFERLGEGPLAVGELARELPVTRPAVSQHLKVLKDAGLVIDRHAGTRRIYQLNPDGLSALRTYLDEFWNRALAAFKEAVEQHDEEVP